MLPQLGACVNLNISAIAFKHGIDEFCPFFMMLIHQMFVNRVDVMRKPLPNMNKDLEKTKRRWRKCRDGEKLSHEWPISLVGIFEIST